MTAGTYFNKKLLEVQEPFLEKVPGRRRQKLTVALTLIFEYTILTENNHSVVGNNSLFHGRTYDLESRLYYFRNRYYHPALGRFLQRDLMGYED